MTPAEVKESLPTRMKHLGITANLLASYSKINGALISLWLNDKGRLTFENTQLLNQRLGMLEDLAEAIRPIPIDFKRVNLVSRLSEQYGRGDLDIHIDDKNFDRLAGGISALAGQMVAHG